jgi:hypothetical protein
MRCLLNDEKLTFMFRSSYVTCYNYGYGYYQINGILSFAVMDLAFKIIKQQKRKAIILKKRKPIIHLLNYIDILNLNSKKFDITFSLKNNYKTQLIYNLYLYRNSYRRRYYRNFYKDSLRVIERENLCIIKLEDDYASRIQPNNLNLAVMLMHILEKEEIDMIDVNGIIFYCVFLM